VIKVLFWALTILQLKIMDKNTEINKQISTFFFSNGSSLYD
jgi:hypothetical protein